MYQNLIIADIEDARVPLEYFQKYKLGSISLASLINENECRQYIVYDVSLKTFDYITEMVITIPKSECKEIIEVSDNLGEAIDLYNCIRNGLVKTRSNEKETYMGKNISNIYSKVDYIIENIYGMDAENKMTIAYDSGNIAIVVSGEEVNENADAFFRTNKVAERLEYDTDLIKINDSICSFNGRFQTIISKKQEKEYHFVPVVYQAQMVWSFLSSMDNTISSFNFILQEQTHLNLTETNNRLISSMVEKIQVLSYKNSTFIASLEQEYDHTYKKFEVNWHLETTLQAQEKYIEGLEGYLNRVSNKKNERSNERQNKILFVISLLQILAFISVWTDFLELGREYGSPIMNLIGVNLEGILSIISMALPIVLLVVSTVLLAMELKRKND